MAAITMKPLGRTGLTVSNIAFGTSGLGGMVQVYGYDVDAQRAQATVRGIFDGPANVIDTSRLYGNGRSEERIGEVIRERGGLPPGFVVSTKLDRDPQTGRFDGAAARRSLETSLKTLGLDRFHVLHLHDPEFIKDESDYAGPQGSTAELMKMKEEGFAQAVGLAAGAVDVMMPLLRDWDFDVLLTHNRFTMLNRNAEEMIDYAIGRGMAVFNAAPYGGGALAKGSGTVQRYAYRDAPQDVMSSLRQIESICAKHGVPPGAAALQFSMRDPRISATVVGVTKPERVSQTVEWATYPIPDAVWEELAGVPYSTRNPQAAD
jgi:D-threo-aldose 1-dehydrogenase